MNASQSLFALTAPLVHPIGSTGAARVRHQIFMMRGLVLLFMTLAVAPFFLAFHGVPSLGQVVLFGFCLGSLGAIMFVSKTGGLVGGHALQVGCLIGLAVTCAITKETSLGCAFAWLVVAQTESILSFDWKLVVSTAAITAIAFCVVVASALAGLLDIDATAGVDVMTGLALGYAICNVLIMTAQRAGHLDAEASSRARANTVVAMVDDLIVTFDREGTVNHVEGDCERRLNVPAGDLFGRGLFAHIHVADRPVFLTAVADAAHGTESVMATIRMRASSLDSREGPIFRWIEMRARRLETSRRGENDAPVAVISLFRDVTDDKRRESEVEAARQAILAASQSRDQFIANMSHELRTPLNAIIGFSEILGNEDLRPRDLAKQVDYARIIHESGHHLLAVVNSILDMSKLQSGTLAIVAEAFEVGTLINSCCEIVSLKAREGRVEMIRADKSFGEPLFGDRRACKQILINLLSNAVKFTPQNGRVTIGAWREGNSLLLSVMDTGIGIDATDLARLGDPFFQAKAAHDRPYEGTGLGLSVVRGLVNLQGGTISVESELGHGTTVTVRLPLDYRDATRRDPTAKIETISRRRSLERFPLLDSKVKKSA